MTLLTYEQKQELNESMMQLAQIQIDIFLSMVSQGVPDHHATDLIKNQFAIMFTAAATLNAKVAE